jgi:putative tributyrin esterase
MSKIQLSFFSQALEMNTSLTVLVPDDLKKNEKLRPFYVLHGYNGDHQDWTRLTAIERYMRNYRACVIMPSGFNAYYTDHIVGLKYYTYFTKELVPFIENLFPVQKEAYILGLSMGGYGAMKFALSNPKKFVKAVSLSGVMNPDFIRAIPWMVNRLPQFDLMFGKKTTGKNDLRFLLEKDIKKGVLPELLLTCGEHDFLIEDNKSFHQFLTDKQVPHTYIFDDGEHNWEYWDRGIQKALPWLFKS